MKQQSSKKKDFETSLRELERIAEKLENGGLSLDASISEFEKGIELAAFCREKITEAEKKIEILRKKGGIISPVEIKTGPDGEIGDDENTQGSLL